jgi:cyanate lyase
MRQEQFINNSASSDHGIHCSESPTIRPIALIELIQTIPTNNSPYADLPPIVSKLFEAKARKGLTFDAIGKAIGRDETWVAAAFYGQAKLSADEIQALSATLDIESTNLQSGLGEHWWPNRGLGPMPPTDPVVYRLYEGILVYGHAIKAVIHEKFGDGIISMVDCKVTVTKKEDPKGNRAVIAFDGKFMPYPKW